MLTRIALFPLTAEVNKKGHLVVGGCDSVQLAEEFGTPLYVFDELGIRRQCAEFMTEFGQRHADTGVIYASKAFMSRALALILKEERLGLDVVSGGELGIAKSVDFPMDKIFFHGNNKSADELRQALDWGVGRIVVDNFYELQLLAGIAKEKGCVPDILLRISPGVDPHTHSYNTTGIVDSKFGFPLVEGEKAVIAAMSAPELNLVGLHFHIGSSIFEVEPYLESIELILGFAAEMKRRHGFEMKELDIGGGFAIQYLLEAPAFPIAVYAEAILAKLTAECGELNLALPRLIIEPGRSIIGRSGLALYRIGVVKDIPGVRRYVSVDGGMADNLRPALYGAKYEAILANKALAANTEKITIAGKFCESGDILIRDIDMPPITAGDILAIPDCGAYCLPVASNYNASLRPAVVMVKEGKARLIRRRETVEDLIRLDLV